MKEKTGRIGETDFLAKLFAGEVMAEGSLSYLKSKVMLKKYVKRQLIYSGIDNTIFCVARGIVKSFKVTDDGNEVFNDVFSKGDLFGNLLFTNGNEHARVISDNAEIYFIRSSDLVKSQSQEFLMSFLSDLENKICIRENYFLKLMSLSIKDRLVFFLEHLAKRRGSQGESGVTIECPLSASEIASSICATRQSVSSHLRQLKKINWLKITRKEIELRDGSFDRYIKIHAQTQNWAA